MATYDYGEKKKKAWPYLLIPFLIPFVAAVAVFLLTKDSLDAVIWFVLLFSLAPGFSIGLAMWLTGWGKDIVSVYPGRNRSELDMDYYVEKTGLLLMIISLMIMTAVSLVMMKVVGVYLIPVSVALIVPLAVVATLKIDKRAAELGTRQSGMDAEYEKKLRGKHWKSAVVFSIFTIFTIIAVVFLMTSYGDVSAELDDDSVSVSAPTVNFDILYEDIQDCELRDGFERGRRVGGYGSSKILSGNFQNEEFGKYRLASYTEVDTCIIITAKDGKHYAFNLDTRDKTVAFHADLMSRLP